MSEKTLAKLIRRNAATFPVLSRGSKGIPYEFDANAVRTWWRDYRARLEEERSSRRKRLAELALSPSVARGAKVNG